MAATKRRKRAAKRSTNADTYRLVADRITAALEQGVVPWHQPWKNFGHGANAPASLSTGKPYQGINVFMLGVTAMTEGYTSRWWGTYRQIGERGGQVRKGEHGTPVVFWRVLVKKDGDGEVTGKIPFLRHFTVFNADQCDGLAIDEDPLALNDVEPVEECERVSDAYRERGGPTLRHGGDEAYYVAATDAVTLPLQGQFESAESYYGTLFHEYAHSTGHASRLKREGVESAAPFGSPVYSKEELIAEMGSAFLCGAAGIDVRVAQSSSYISGWMSAINDDPKILVAAAAAAQRAADHILGIDRGNGE